MKSQRRHELQTNYLADHLGTAVQTGKPYAMWVAVGLVSAVVLAIGYGIYSSQAAKANAQAWGDYYFNIGAGDAEVFQQVAEDHPNTPASEWALQAWADNQLLLGLDQIHANRKQAEGTIQNAIDAYEGILKSSYQPELKNRAAMGLAQGYESLGKLDDAARYYQQVASGSQDGFASLARQRLAWIKSGDGKSFYDWFASVRSTPEPPPTLPGDLSKPPQAPDMDFPKKQNPLTLPGAQAPIEFPPAPADSAPSESTSTDSSPAGITPKEATVPSGSLPDAAPTESSSGLKIEPAAPAGTPAPSPAPAPPSKPVPEPTDPSADIPESNSQPSEVPKF